MKITYKRSDEIYKGVVIYRKKENSFDFIADKCGGHIAFNQLFAIKY